MDNETQITAKKSFKDNLPDVFRDKTRRAEVSAFFGALVILCISPFFLPTGYIQMTWKKDVFFLFSAVLFFVLTVIFHTDVKKEVRKIRVGFKNTQNISLLVFVGLTAISTVFSLNPAGSVTGNTGRFMGLLMFICVWMVYFTVSQFMTVTSQYLIDIFGIIVILINFFTFFQYIGLNPFGFYTGISEESKFKFISFFGNMNIYSSWCCLAVPVFMWRFVTAKSKQDKIFNAVVLFFGFFGCFMCGSDGVYLGIVPAFIILFFLLCKDKYTLAAFFRVLAVFCFTSFVSFTIRHSGADLYHRFAYVTYWLNNPYISSGCLVLTAVASILIPKMKIGEKFIRRVKILFICAGSLVALTVVALIVYFTFISTDNFLGAYTKYFRLSENWGTYRGWIWIQSLKCFKEMPFMSKLIGTGPETLKAALKLYTGTATMESENLSFDAAHSEYIHLLVTHGILGLAAYLTFTVSAIVKCFRSRSNLAIAWALGAACYMTQAIINIAQPISTPMLFVLLALGIASTGIKNEENTVKAAIPEETAETPSEAQSPAEE